MLIPAVNLPTLMALAASLSFLDGPQKATRLALFRDVLGAAEYPAGAAMRQTLTQTVALFGYCAGGILSTVVGPQTCIAADAVSFAVTALIVRFRIQRRSVEPKLSDRRNFMVGIAVVWADRRCRLVLISVLLGGFYIAPEGVAAPYVLAAGLDLRWVGVVLACPAVGGLIGAPLFARIVRFEKYSLVFPYFCVATGLTLVVIPLANTVEAMCLIVILGALWAVQVVILVSLMADYLPSCHLAQGMGIASSLNLSVVGLGIGVAGFGAQMFSASLVVASSGFLSIIAAVMLAIMWVREP
jgi:hypothetical protein